MLGNLFGNRNMERILLFLFVNQRCYGTQLHILLRVPLTPIQKALARLEQSGIICSHYEGKTRVYEFNFAHPLRQELELLLKKVYTLLPCSIKKDYCFIHKPRLPLAEEGKRERCRREELLALWQRLGQTQSLSL